MKASEILSRARALADLGETKFIDHAFALASLNEAWRDVYSVLLDNDDDYYLTETTLTLSSAVAVAGTQGEYLISLPSDAVKVRYLDYKGSDDYVPMQKFGIGTKDDNPGDPHYRLKNGQLWVKGGSVPPAGLTIRLGYYPTPATITAPAAPWTFSTSYALGDLASVTAPAFAALNNTATYAYGGTGLSAESIDRGTVAVPVALFTEAAASTSVLYYKGYLYWVRAANIYRKATDMTAAFLTPVAVTASGDVVDFQIYNDLIYFITATAVKTCSLTGTGTATLASGLTCTKGAALLGAVVYYVDTGVVKSVTPAATLVASGAVNVTSDGTYLYVSTTAYGVNRYTLVAGAITATAAIHTDCLTMGPAGGGRLPIIQNNAQRLVAIDTAVDYDFTFPNNLVPEIMTYRCAIDYRIKQSQDVAGLTARLEDMWKRFSTMVRRDDYKPERIHNVYRWNA